MQDFPEDLSDYRVTDLRKYVITAVISDGEQGCQKVFK